MVLVNSLTRFRSRSKLMSMGNVDSGVAERELAWVLGVSLLASEGRGLKLEPVHLDGL